MSLDRGLERWLAGALADDRIEVLPVTREIAVAGAAFSGRLRDPADQLIYATALAYGAVLVSRDAAMRELDPRRVAW
jgi:PIN domain nuclease of toxin-antitoxin system